MLAGLASIWVHTTEAATPTEPEPVKPDLSKPVWVIIQCDKTAPPQMSAEQKKTHGGLAHGLFFKAPAGVGFALERGKVTRPWLSSVAWIGSGTGADVLNWTHTPISFRDGFRFTYEQFSLVEAAIAADRFTVRMQGTCRQTDTHVPEPIAFDLNLAGTIAGARMEGTWKGTIGGFPCQGTCVGAVLQAASAALDPANAVYQIMSYPQGVAAVVEVRGGKGVAGLALRKRAGGGESPAVLAKLFDVDVSALMVTAGEPNVAGRSGKLKGTLRIAGVGDMSVEDLEISPTGFGGYLRSKEGSSRHSNAPTAESPIGIRAYPIDDPVASQWKRWMQAVYAGTAPLDQTIAQEVRREAETLVCLPAPSQATQFLHRYVGFGMSFIYAPWFDFKPVDGAKRYRFAVGPASFEAETPTAWLSPIWENLPPGGHGVTLTALDAGGKPVGEAQKRSFTKRAPFGGETARGIADDDLARDVALRYPRALVERHYENIVSLWAEIASPPHDLPYMNAPRVTHDPFAVLARWSPDAGERARSSRLADAWKILYIPTLRRTPLGSTEDYFSFGFVQQTLNNYLSTHEATNNPRLLEEARHWADVVSRLIQPNGSWTWIYTNGGFSDPDAKRRIYAPFMNVGRGAMDHDAAPYVNFYGRLRKLTGDDRHRDTELKGVHWLMHNSLRDGYWPHQQQQSDPADSHLANTMAIECLEYLLERAPATVANAVLAEELARYIEDRWIEWGPISRIGGGQMTNSGQVPMALNYLRLWRVTGKALHRAKAEALFHSYLLDHDPVLGLPQGGSLSAGTSITFNRYLAEYDDPAWALRYLELRRALDRAPATKAISPDNAVSVLRLQDGVAKAEPIGLYLNLQHQRLPSPSPQRSADPVYVYLDAQGGKVRHAIATTPNWDGPILDYPQCGRLHWQDGMALFHDVDASTLTVGPKGIQGEVVVHLKAPLPDRQPVAASYRIEAAMDGRMLAGRHDGGLLAGEVRPPAAANAEHLWFEMDRAVLGGEPWQNWALAQFDLPGITAVKGRAPRWLGNGNAGWAAEVQAADVKLTDATVSGTMKANVNYFGFRDGTKDDVKYHLAAWEQGLSFLAYWNTSESFFGRPTPHKPERGSYIKYTPLGLHLEYFTSSQPVTPGQYEYRLDGRRLGDVVAGTVTVKGPDGKEHTCRFLGGVE